MTSSSRKQTEEQEPRVRFVVGIDLGTTNCAASYVDLDRLERAEGTEPNATVVETLLIPQAVAPNVIEERATLPSFFARLRDVPLMPWETSETRRDLSLKGRGAKSPKDGKYGVVGAYARDYGVSSYESFVSSAKSWLCHSGVDRSAPILPWTSTRATGSSEKSSEKSSEESNAGSNEPERRWSPVEISSFYLAHIRAAWNARFAEFPLETQDVVLTIPASFDETARTLTLDAAKRAGLTRVALVEEPQAAFYSWLARHENDWTDYVRPGQRILVCDVGGGTTDFALIYALEREQTVGASTRAKNVKFYRVAVGDHLVLGGDNLDLALYRLLEQKILEKRATPLTAREESLLLKESRDAKEYFLSATDSSAAPRRIVLPGVGSKLVGGGVAVDVTRAEVDAILVDGFFPRVAQSSVPARRRSGLRELALPYASDPAVTKYLTHFLNTRRRAGDDLVRAGVLGGLQRADANGAEETSAAPEVVLFNGGAFESAKLRRRVVESLAAWRGEEEGEAREPVVLENKELYLAVARGAAYYGLVLRGHGARIGASLARTYYVGVALEKNGATDGARPKGVCLLPAQCEPGDEIALEKTFELAVDRPVSFPIFVSSVRTTDAPGDLIEIDPNETRELSPIRTALKTRSRAKKEAQTIRAQLVARPTEIGAIELYLQELLPEGADRRARASRWTLQFDARGGVQSDWEASANDGESEGVVDESLLDAARRVLLATFGTDEELNARNAERPEAPLERVKPNELYRRLTEAVGTSKNELPLASLRRLAEATLELSAGRRRSAQAEARWLNWLGFALRPGFGAATDDWRVEQTWKAVGGQLAFKTPECRAQYWILWRRVASGLTAGRQLTIAEPLLANLRALRRQLVEGRGKGPDLDLTSQEGAEIWRLLGALELLPVETKEELGDAILDVFSKKKTRPVRDALAWALGRLGARVLFHAPLDRVVRADVAERWTTRLFAELERVDAPTSNDFFALAELTRLSDESGFNVSLATREKVASFLIKHGAEESTLAALEKRGKLIDDATKQVFGEALPLGLRWN